MVLLVFTTHFLLTCAIVWRLFAPLLVFHLVYNEHCLSN